jgi:hypothetical protein
VNEGETYLDESMQSRLIMTAYPWASFGERAMVI